MKYSWTPIKIGRHSPVVTTKTIIRVDALRSSGIQPGRGKSPRWRALDEFYKEPGKCSFLPFMTKSNKRREKWHGFEYYVRKIPEQWKTSWDQSKATHGNLPYHVPQKIIPRQLKKIPYADFQDEPEIIKYQYGIRSFWYACHCNMKITTTITLHYGKYYSMRQTAILKMVAYIIRADVDRNDFVNKLAGADISVINTDNVIMATITGFSDMPYYHKLIDITLDAIHAVTLLHADDYYSYKRSLSNRIYWKNFNDELEIANDYLRAFVRMQSYDNRRISQELDYINAATFRETADRILAAKRQTTHITNLYCVQQTCPILILSTLTLNITFFFALNMVSYYRLVFLMYLYYLEDVPFIRPKSRTRKTPIMFLRFTGSLLLTMLSGLTSQQEFSQHNKNMAVMGGSILSGKKRKMLRKLISTTYTKLVQFGYGPLSL
eukprot:sb/3464837/